MSENNNTEKTGDYEVGRGKPPKEHRFRPGQSGNRKGRPKNARGLKTDLKDELNERITITENGRTRRMTKQRLMVKQLTAKALKGDIRAIGKLSDLATSLLGAEDDIAKETARLSDEDEAILKSLRDRLKDDDDD